MNLFEGILWKVIDSLAEWIEKARGLCECLQVGSWQTLEFQADSAQLLAVSRADPQASITQQFYHVLCSMC